MTKPATARRAYNVLFQEHEVGKHDTGQSCHIFAIGSPVIKAERKALNERFCEIGQQYAIDVALGDRPKAVGEELRIMRDANMATIAALREEQDTALEVDDLYLCGGFREGNAMPEHMWIEDRTNGRTFDTFIDRHGIAVRNCTGEEDEAFQPGCEADVFEADEIFRVKVSGYTMGQLIAIAAGAEKTDAVDEEVEINDSFGAIEEEPQVKAAKEVAKFVNKYVSAKRNKDEYPEENRVRIAASVEDKYVDIKDRYQRAATPELDLRISVN